MPAVAVRLTDLGTTRVRAQIEAREEILTEVTLDTVLLMDSAGVKWPSADTSGRVPTAMAAGSVPNAARFAPTQESWPDPPERTVTAAGNASITMITPTPLGGTRPVYVIEGILYTYVCNVTVATRTTAAPTLVSGLTKSGTLADASLVDTLSLTASQEGSVFASSNGTRWKNENGTFTFTANGSPCPWDVEAFSADVAAATNGQAMDVHTLTLLIRQVA